MLFLTLKPFVKRFVRSESSGSFGSHILVENLIKDKKNNTYHCKTNTLDAIRSESNTAAMYIRCSAISACQCYALYALVTIEILLYAHRTRGLSMRVNVIRNIRYTCTTYYYVNQYSGRCVYILYCIRIVPRMYTIKFIEHRAFPLADTRSKILNYYYMVQHQCNMHVYCIPLENAGW